MMQMDARAVRDVDPRLAPADAHLRAHLRLPPRPPGRRPQARAAGGARSDQAAETDIVEILVEPVLKGAE